MDPSDNNPNKRILPNDYCNDMRETKKIKSTTEEMEIFSGVDFENNNSVLENLNEIEACDLTEEYKKLPEVWHAAKRKDWDTVSSLLPACENCYCCPSIGPDKDKTIIILAILSEQWDIVDYINDGENKLVYLPEIDELEKLIKIIVRNKRWELLFTEFISERITRELFDLILNQAVNTRDGEDFENAINSILDLFRDCSFSLTNKQFNDVVLYYLKTLPKSSDKEDDLWEHLNDFFEIYSESNLTLDFDVHVKLVEFYNEGVECCFDDQDVDPSEITFKRIFKVDDDIDLMLTLLNYFSFYNCAGIKNLIRMNPWFNEISLKERKEQIKVIIENMISLNEKKEQIKATLKAKNDLDLMKIILDFQARTCISFDPLMYKKLYFQTDFSVFSSMFFLACDGDVSNFMKHYLQTIPSGPCERISRLIDAGIEIPNIDKFSIPIFDTFDRIYEIWQWEETFNNGPQRLPQDINLEIALILIAKELPELSFLPDSFFVEKMNAYFAKKH